jgi:hypothetical protein
LDRTYGGAATALKNKGVTEARILQLANKENPINIARHNQIIDMLLAAKNGNPQRSVQGADDIAEVLGDELIRLKYPADKGFTIKYGVELRYGTKPPNAKFDTVVLDSEGYVVAVAETKSTTAESLFRKAGDQIEKGRRTIQMTDFDNVLCGDGTNIQPDKIKYDKVKEYMKIGPKDAPYSYTDKLWETADEITELETTLLGV